MRRSLLALLLAGATSAALAQDSVGPQPTPAETSGAHSGDIIVRFDAQSGRMSICGPIEGDWVCRLAPDDHAALAAEIEAANERAARLEERIATLEAEVEALREADPSGGREAEPSLSREEEMDAALDFTEEAMRRFFGLVREMQGEDTAR